MITTNDVYLKLKESREMLDSLQAFILNYEGLISVKEGELRVLDNKIAAKKAENEAAGSKASLVLAKASEEAAGVRKQAQDLLDMAHLESIKAKKDLEIARGAISEAKARSAKLESDEKAFNANVIIFERKKQAIESALHVG